jgi:hypothetical protein
LLDVHGVNTFDGGMFVPPAGNALLEGRRYLRQRKLFVADKAIGERQIERFTVSFKD